MMGHMGGMMWGMGLLWLIVGVVLVLARCGVREITCCSSATDRKQPDQRRVVA